MSQTLAATLHQAEARLRAQGIESPRLEAEVLLCDAAGLSRTALIAWPERRLDPGALARVGDLIRRRANGEPIAYILGRREFWGIDLAVTPATLIPRPETELLVDLALAELPAEGPVRCADLGTGSGAIAIALASERPAWTLIATDRSAPALAVAAANAKRLGLGNVYPLQANWLAPFAAACLDAILANPPYVRAHDPHLGRGDLRFEPHAALAAGPDGLDAIRRISENACRCLRPGGWIAIEHGLDQGSGVRALMAAAGLREPRTARDLAGHERITMARRPRTLQRA